jgi:integrase
MSVRERTWTYKGKQRSAWLVDYTDADGKRRNKQFDTKREALDWSAQTRIEIKQGVHVADGDSITIAEAGKLWIATCRSNELERSTLGQYQRHLDLHITPLIGTTKLNKLNLPAVRAFQDKMREAGRSAALTRKVVTSLGSIVADAMERGLVTHNPVRERKRRSKATKRHRVQLEVGVHIPTTDEIRTLLNAATGYSRALFATAALAGLRLSELRGLRWQDVDFAASTISVRQRADAWGALGRPKAAASRRTIPVPSMVIAALKEWKLACPRRDTGQADEDGTPIRVLDLVFPADSGGVESHGSNIRRAWHVLQVAAGVSVPALDKTGAQVLDEDGNVIMAPKYGGLHALRHFFCSWCANSPKKGGLGLSLKETQVRMGHGTLSMTADLYGHLFVADEQRERDILAAGERALMGA